MYQELKNEAPIEPPKIDYNKDQFGFKLTF